MCVHTCDRSVIGTAALCDDCMTEAYEIDQLADRAAEFEAILPATEAEYQRHMLETTVSAEEYRELEILAVQRDPYAPPASYF